MVSARPSPNQVDGNYRVHGNNGQFDPMQLLAQLQGPSSQDLYADAMAQITGPYQAQLNALAQQAQQARDRGRNQDRELANLYGGLQNQIKGEARGIGQNYDQAYGGVKRNTAEGVNAINRTYSDTRNELAGLFSKLGIQAAAPDAMREGAQDQSLLSGLLNVRGNSAMQSLTTDKAAALQFNNVQANAAGLQGKNRRADLMQALNDRLSAIGNQQNEVQGAMSSQIAQRQYQLEQDAMSRQMQMQNMLMQSADAAGGGQRPGLTPAQEYTQMGPDERGYYKASQLFGPQAGYAMQLVSGVANNQNGGVYQNIAHFIRSVLAENQKQQSGGRPALSNSELQALASYFWDQGGTGRRPPEEEY